MELLYILLVIALLSGILSVWCTPVLPQKENGDNAAKNNSDMYSISSQTQKVNNNCTQELHIDGKGIEDNFTLPCSNGEITSFKSNKLLIYDDPKNSFSLFSDRPSSLVVIEGGKCTNRTYTTAGITTFSSSVNISDLECNKIKEKIDRTKDEFNKSWKLWQKNFEDSMKIIFPPCFPLCYQAKDKDILNKFSLKTDQTIHAPTEI